MPTTPMASAIGIRSSASSIIASRPISVSVMTGSGGRLVGAAFAGHEYLVAVHEAREGDHRVHEIDEWPHRNAQHVGGVAIGGDRASLDPDLPGQEEHDRGAGRVREAHQR